MSHSTVTKVTNAIEPVLREWETRPIPKGIVYLMLDAIYLPVRRPGFIRKQALLVALGVTPEGRRQIGVDREHPTLALLQLTSEFHLQPSRQQVYVFLRHRGVPALVIHAETRILIQPKFP